MYLIECVVALKDRKFTGLLYRMSLSCFLLLRDFPFFSYEWVMEDIACIFKNNHLLRESF